MTTRRLETFIWISILALAPVAPAWGAEDCEAVVAAYGDSGHFNVPAACFSALLSPGVASAHARSSDGKVGVSGGHNLLVVDLFPPLPEGAAPSVMAPLRQPIAGSATGLRDVRAVALDAGKRYVAALDGKRILIFHLRRPGNVPPLRAFEAPQLGKATKLVFGAGEIQALSASDALVFSVPLSPKVRRK